MRNSERYQPLWIFPPYSYIPGLNPHPNHVGGYRDGVSDPIAKPVDFKNPHENDFLRFALDLYNHEYYWESHIYFEALWNAHGRKGAVCDFFKAMIKLGAAGVKRKQGRFIRGNDFLKQASDLFASVKKREGAFFLGFDFDLILREIESTTDAASILFDIHPRWSRDVGH
jgi:hypothetical protein